MAVRSTGSLARRPLARPLALAVGAVLALSIVAQLVVDRAHLFSLQAFALNSVFVCALVAWRLTGRRAVLLGGLAAWVALLALLEAGTQLGLSLDSYASKVRNCYTWFDIVQRSEAMGDTLDLTEGVFDCDPFRPYDDAQREQREQLLDALGVVAGTRLFDIGCGNCNLLETAKARGADARGITLSHEQARLCRERRGIPGVDVVDFWDLRDPAALARYAGRFDCVVFNGPVEHFVDQADSVAGRKDARFAEMFAIVHALIDPASSNRRCVITCIHLDESRLGTMSAWDWMQGYLYERSYGGSLPVYPDGLSRNAERVGFELLSRADHTMDYYIMSSLFWHRINRGNLEPRVLARCAATYPFLALYDRYFWHRLLHQLFGSWTWQFEPPSLGRHLWLVLRKGASPL